MKWISVDDYLPETNFNRRILACFSTYMCDDDARVTQLLAIKKGDGDVGFGYFGFDCVYHFCNDVTHWMELPPPPEATT